MRILQVATLVSPAGEYGGPLTVATNQCNALRELGHEAELAAGYRGYESPPARRGTVPLHLFPARQLVPGTGFAGLTSPGLLRWLIRNLDSYDALHVHLARDLVTLPVAVAAVASGVRLVLQTHGMITPSSRALATPLDTLATRRVLRHAHAVCYLTDGEAVALEKVARSPLHLHQLTNGVPTHRSSVQPAASREVIFLARLQTRKRPLAYVQAASALLNKHPDTTFSLVGPDEGEGGAVQAAISLRQDPRLRWEGPIAPDSVIDRLGKASLYVLPSVDEPYPMGVLEAMSQGIPVVVTRSCGLAKDIIQHACGIVVDDQVSSLTRAMDELLSDESLRRRLADNARKAAAAFSMSSVATKLQTLYAQSSPNSDRR